MATKRFTDQHGTQAQVEVSPEGVTLEAMKEKAAERLAGDLFGGVLADSYKALLHAGWSDADVRLIQDAALRQCLMHG